MHLGKLWCLTSHEFSLKLQIFVMVSTAVSKMGMTESIFVVPGMKVNGQYYHDVLFSQQMLPAIFLKHVASDTFVLSTRQRCISSCKDTIKQLQEETPDFNHWSWSLATKQPRPESTGLLSLECYTAESMNVVWTVSMSWSQLKLRLIDIWNSLQQNIIDAASMSGESNWEHACMQMDNILNTYCECVWLTKVMDK